jgi:hypothetical protein
MPETRCDHTATLLDDSVPVPGVPGTFDVERYLTQCDEQRVTVRWPPKLSGLLSHAGQPRTWQISASNKERVLVIWDIDLIPVLCPDWLVSVLHNVARLAALPSDWDGEGSPPPSLAAISTLLGLLQGLTYYSLPTPFVCPLREGGLQIEWRQGQRELEVEFWDAEYFEYLKVFEDGSMEEGKCPAFDLRAFRRLVEWLDAGV